MMRTVEGKVGRIEWVQRGDKKWFLAHLYNELKPVAFGYDPGVKPGARLGVEVSEGQAWLFCGHRTPAITPPKTPTFKIEEEIPEWKGKAGRVAEIIWAQFKLHGKQTVASDDVLDAITRTFPESDPRIAGVGFQFLSRKGLIHEVGERKTYRKQRHYTKIKVWELTRR